MKAGFNTVNVDYPSRYSPIKTLANTTIPAAITECLPEKRAHFVSHSLGGILIWQYMKTNPTYAIGRVVMLGPPNQGSELVDKLSGLPGISVMGPAFQALGTDANSVPNQLGPVYFELGVIAGSRTLNPLFSLTIPGSDDGKVSVMSTEIEGMNDHIIRDARLYLCQHRFKNIQRLYKAALLFKICSRAIELSLRS